MEVKTTSALEGTVEVVKLTPATCITDIPEFLSSMRGECIIKLPLKIKFYLALTVQFNSDGKKIQSIFRSKNYVAAYPFQVAHQVDEALSSSVENFHRCGSGWVVSAIKSIAIHKVKYMPLQGSTYTPLP